MANTFMDRYFGPLPRDYCVYFYVLSIIFGVSLALTALSIAGFMITNFKKVNMMFIINSVFVLLNIFLGYIANRLLHTMCVKSI
jgi:hypothetical protein